MNGIIARHLECLDHRHVGSGIICDFLVHFEKGTPFNFWKVDAAFA